MIQRLLAVVFATVMLAGIGLLQGCKEMGNEPDPPENETPGTPVVQPVSFQARIVPMFSRYGCAGCHGGSGGLFVGTVAQLLTGGDHGPAIIPGDGANSNLVKKLGTPPPFGSRMPFGGNPLPADTIAVIRAWIDQGALNN